MSGRPGRSRPLRCGQTRWRCLLVASSAALVVWLLGIAAEAAKPAPRKRLGRVEQLLEQWRIGDADRVLTALESEEAAGPRPRLLRLRGEILFLRGDYDGALATLRQAVQAETRERAAARLRASVELVQATAAARKGMIETRSAGGNFRIFTRPGRDALLAPFAGETLEAAREALQRQLGFAPAEPVRVEIYPDAGVLARVTTLTEGEIRRSGTIAVCKFNRLMIVTPRALVRGYPWLDTLAHEYVHLVVALLSHNTVPVWLQEGFASYLERSWREPSGAPARLAPAQEHLLAGALRQGRLVGWSQMHPSMAKLPDQRTVALAFAQVQTAVELMVQIGGEDALKRLIEALRAGNSDWQAVRAATRLDQASFERRWREHLRGLKLRRLAGFVPQERRFGRAPSQEKQLAAVGEERAARFLRLADMLRARGLTHAAIIEYQKARAILGTRDDLVANHLARAYLEIASPAQAISSLQPVLEYYPELPAPQVTMGLAHLRNGDQAAAAEHLRVALRLNPFDPDIHCGLAQALGSTSAGGSKRHARLCATLSGEPATR